METTQLVALFFLSGEDNLKGVELSFYTNEFGMAYKRNRRFADTFNADATFELMSFGHQGKAPFEPVNQLITENGLRITIISKSEMSEEDTEEWKNKITEFLKNFGNEICVYNILITTSKVKREYIVLRE
jgi:hypothetical protein